MSIFKMSFVLAVSLLVMGTVFAQDTEEDSSLLPDVLDGKAPIQADASPFERSRLGKSKNLWADSWLFLEVPRLDAEGKILPEDDSTSEIPAAKRLAQFLQVEEWYGAAPPDLNGKFVLIEVWATWCPPCRRTLPMLNHWHEKYADDLVVISICETDRAAIDKCPGKLQGKDLTHYVGIDTKRRCANALNVFGIPHAILVEPMYGGIVWEGMPNQPNFELTDDIIDRILAIGKKAAQP